MKRAVIPSIMLGLSVLAVCIAAQAPTEGLAAKVIAARKANLTLMKQYTWNSRTEIVKDGKTLDIRIDLVQYGPDGTLMRTELNNESNAPHPRGFLRKRIADDKKKEMEDYIKGLRSLLEQYTLPTEGKVVDFMSSANIQFSQAPDGSQVIQIKGSDVVKPGDSMTIWAGATDHKMKKVQISTTYEDGSAEVTATYKSKPNGLTYMSFAEVELPKKNMSLMIHNYDYEQND